MGVEGGGLSSLHLQLLPHQWSSASITTGFYKQASGKKKKKKKKSLADTTHLAMLKTFVFTGRILAHYLIIDCVYLVK